MTANTATPVVSASLTMLTDMFTIQNGLNTKSYDAAWLEKGRTEEFDYKMAAGDEIHEFLRSLPFQWWIGAAPDRANQITELVDAWHFIMSQALIDWDGKIEPVCRAAERAYNYAKSYSLEETVKKQAKLLVAALYLEGTGHDSGNLDYLPQFFALCRKAEVSLELLYARYLAKSTLNKFRVDNGYKRKEYLKHWTVNGEQGEDNYFLARWVDSRLEDPALPLLTSDEVTNFLTQMYAIAKVESVTNSQSTVGH